MGPGFLTDRSLTIILRNESLVKCVQVMVKPHEQTNAPNPKPETGFLLKTAKNVGIEISI